MSYCRYRNTLTDLQDCEDNLFEPIEHNTAEAKARRMLIELCHDIAQQVGLDELDKLPVEDND